MQDKKARDPAKKSWSNADFSRRSRRSGAQPVSVSAFGILDDQLERPSSIPVVPLQAIGDLFEPAGRFRWVNRVELDGCVSAPRARFISQNHPPVAAADGLAGMHPNPGGHEQRTGVALAERAQTLDIVQDRRRDVGKGEVRVDAQGCMQSGRWRQTGHCCLQTVPERLDPIGPQRQAGGHGMSAETVQKVRTLVQRCRQIDAVNTTGRPFGLAVGRTDHHRRPVEPLGQARSDNAQEAFVPAMTMHHENRRRRSLWRSRQLGHGKRSAADDPGPNEAIAKSID
ncbi:MAG TPA: hypothetical protein VLT88_08185, partial [Desulfosarcina sp.]|nr:hypothetical protein [Desulfosarcina sp.]